MSLVVESRPAEWPDPCDAAGARLPAETEYHFLLGRFIDAATLARANVLAGSSRKADIRDPLADVW